MKLNILSLAAVAALGVSAGSAFALSPAQYQVTAGDTAELFISGATAQEAGLRNTLARMCTVGSLDVYQFSNQQAAFCTINKTVVTGSIPASVTKMVVYKSGVGGSGNGIGPVADSGALQFISLAALKATPALVGASSAIAAVAPTAPDTIGIPAYNRVDVSTSATQNVVTEAGFSDVEPKLLGGTSTQISKLKVVAPNVLLIGVPVTIAARNALQQAQSLTVGSDAVGDMPSLRKDLIASVYTGNITSWSQLGATLADPTIYLATRVESSGTQKSFNVNITGAACSANVQPVLAGTGTAADCTSATPGATVVAGSGSGDVTACLAGHQANSRGAFGVLSMEFVPAASGSNSGYRYIKIDGFAPTLTNVVNGNYNHWVEPTFQYRKAPGSPVLSGVKQIIADRIVTQLGAEAVITSLDNAFVQPFGRSGLLARPSGSNLPNVITPPTSDAAVAANPTNAFTRSPLGSPVNCQPPVLFN